MKRSTIVIIGIILLAVFLLCAALAVALLAAWDNDASDWRPRWDRDRTQWDSRMWVPMDSGRVGLPAAGLPGRVNCLPLTRGSVRGGVSLANSMHFRPQRLGEPAG